MAAHPFFTTNPQLSGPSDLSIRQTPVTEIRCETQFLLGCPLEVSKWLVNVVINLLINGIYWGYNPCYNPLILTFDPNFLGHPSSTYHKSWYPEILGGFTSSIRDPKGMLCI